MLELSKDKKHESTILLVSIYMELAITYKNLDRFDDTKRLLSEAKLKFADDPLQLSRIKFEECDILAKQGYTDLAINKLDNIEKTSLYYFKAKILTANLAYKQRRDYKLFIKCYMDILKVAQTKEEQQQGLNLLGDAYMRLLKI
eukprot:UN02511